jgi:hypothetical protein
VWILGLEQMRRREARPSSTGGGTGKVVSTGTCRKVLEVDVVEARSEAGVGGGACLK